MRADESTVASCAAQSDETLSDQITDELKCSYEKGIVVVFMNARAISLVARYLF